MAISAQSVTRPTIRDVAAEANVSTSTVSLYIQQDPRVAKATGTRIAAAIRKLGYVHRPRIKTSRRSALFGLLMEDLSLSAFPESIYGPIIRSIEAEARRHNLSMLVATTQAGQLPQAVLDGQVQGVIMLGGSPVNDNLALDLAARQVPVVLVDAFIAGAPIEAILPDNEWGGYLAVQHLIELGHDRIGIIEGPHKYRTLSDRLWGALRAAEEQGSADLLVIRQPSLSSGVPNKGYREMKALLNRAVPPTGVFAVSDRTAFGALEAIREAGLSVPDDISLVGFDDALHAEHAIPPLTTVHYARDQMGTLAVRRLIATMQGRHDLPVRTAFFTELVIRASTAPPRGVSMHKS